MTPNLTVTIVPFQLAPIMMESNWEFVCLNPNKDAFRSRGDGSVMLKKPGDIPTRNSDGLEVGLKPKRGDQNGDETPPEFKNVVVANDGLTVRVTFDEPMFVGPTHARGMKLTTPTDVVRLLFTGVNDTNPKQVFFTADRVIRNLATEGVITLSYKQPVGGFQDNAGNDVVSITGYPVTNNSSQS